MTHFSPILAVKAFYKVIPRYDDELKVWGPGLYHSISFSGLKRIHFPALHYADFFKYESLIFLI